jgi:adenylate kinase
MHVILLGPPGAGKGTQAKVIERQWHVPHISTGDLLRAAVTERTEFGVQAKGYMDRGELVPDDLVVRLLAERIRRPDSAGGFLLDGFPRNVAQAEVLDRMLHAQGRRIDHVVSLDVDREELVRRISGRRSCSVCGAVYHVANDPPARDGVCSRCGGQLIQRADDNEETVRARLAVYDQATAPLRDEYRRQGLLREIDGSGSVAEVSARIANAVDGQR